jgi:hypothetical protein
MELFNVVPEGRRVIYFDLDVLLMNDLSLFYEVIEEQNSVLMLRSALAAAAGKDLLSNSIMTWKGRELVYLYEAFLENPSAMNANSTNRNALGDIGDQGFMRKYMNPNKFQDFLPSNYILDKQDYLKKSSLIDKATILNWHGRPRFNMMVNRQGRDHGISKVWKENISWELETIS